MVPGTSPVVIADAGPLIALSLIGRLEVLRQVFGQVWITETVRRELTAGGAFPGQEELVAALEGWLRVAEVDVAGFEAINPDIDPGEASSICLAERCADSLLVIDDRAGRIEAQARGLRFIGLIGVMRRARQIGAIGALRPVLEDLRRANYFLGDALIAEVLRSVGEVP